MHTFILVLGIGNVLLTDEGIGVRASTALQKLREVWPSHVRILDGGTQGIHLLNEISNCDILLVLDAVQGGNQPGTLYRMENDELGRRASGRASVHQADLTDVLFFAELSGKRPQTIVLGMEPQDIESVGTSLSPMCQQRLPELVNLACAELQRMGVNI